MRAIDPNARRGLGIETTFDNRKAIEGQTETPERCWVVDPNKGIFLIFTLS
jgi:hypothetical protein